MSSARNNGKTRPKRTQAERNELAERRLLDAALRIVAEKGTTRTTLADVGDVSGYSRGLASHYFGSKTGLLVALVEHVRQTLFQQLRVPPNPEPGLETVLRIVSVYLRPSRDLALTQRALYALRNDAMQTDSEVSERMRNHYRESEKYVAEHLRKGIERGEIYDSVDPATQAVVILCLMQGIIAQWLVNPEGVNLSQAREEVLSSLRRSLQASPAAAKPPKSGPRKRKVRG